MELLYTLLKVISMLATGAFGVLALLTKYKDDQGKITKWGKIAVGGILISSGISLVLYTLESYRAKDAAIRSKAESEATKQKLEIIVANATEIAKQQERSLKETEILKSGLETALERSDEIAKGMDKSLTAQESVLSGNKKIFNGVTDAVQKQIETLGLTKTALQDTDRLLNPINSLQMRMHLTIPLETPGVPQYVSRISGDLDPFFQSLENSGNWKREAAEKLSSIGLETPMPSAIGIPQGSPFYPNENLDGRTADILNVWLVELAFYHKPIDPTQFRPFNSRTDQGNLADIRASFVSAPVSLKTSPLRLHYFGSQSGLEIRGDLVTDPEEWMLSGNLLSIRDLAGGQLFISLGPMGRGTGENKVDWFPERQKYSFSTLYLRISKRMFKITGEELIQYQTKDGSPYWCYRFP